MTGDVGFGRLATAMVTPFDEAGSLDAGAAVELASFLAANGSEWLVVAGTTGESPVLGEEEKLELWRRLSAEAGVPIVAGATSNDTAHSVELTRKAQDVGAAGILAITPYYNRPSQEGLLVHFSAIAEATSLPVVLYDIPVRTGRKIATETVLSLARSHENVVALKDAAGNPAETARLIAKAPAGFAVYSGDDALTLPLLSVGAVGAISVASHWIGPEIAEMMRAFFAGDVSRAARLNGELEELVSFQSSDDYPNPLPAKAMLRAMGHRVGGCRPPHGPAGEELEARAKALLSHLGKTRSAERASVPA